MYNVLYSKQSIKDIEKLKSAGLTKKAKQLIDVITVDPFVNPPPVEKLIGNLNGYYSRRINIKHRLLYLVDEEQKIIKIARMWTHYE